MKKYLSDILRLVPSQLWIPKGNIDVIWIIENHWSATFLITGAERSYSSDLLWEDAIYWVTGLRMFNGERRVTTAWSTLASAMYILQALHRSLRLFISLDSLRRSSAFRHSPSSIPSYISIDIFVVSKSSISPRNFCHHWRF